MMMRMRQVELDGMEHRMERTEWQQKKHGRLNEDTREESGEFVCLCE